MTGGMEVYLYSLSRLGFAHVSDIQTQIIIYLSTSGDYRSRLQFHGQP